MTQIFTDKEEGKRMQGELPEGWTIQNLGDISSKVVDGSHNPPKKSTTGLPMLSGRNVNGGEISYSPARLITSENFKKEHKRTNVEDGNVLLTIVGTIGRAAVVPRNHQPFTLQRSVAVIETYALTPDFLRFQLESPTIQKFLKLNARGTAQKGVYLKTLRSMPLLLPPLAEQKRIVTKIEELFSELDAGEESFKLARKQLGIYRQSLLKQAFEGKLTEAWRKATPDLLEDPKDILARIQQERESRHQQQLTNWQQAVEQWEQNGKEGKKPGKPRKFKPILPAECHQTNLTKLPQSWKWVKLGNITQEIQIGPFGTQLHKSEYTASGVPVINPKHIKNHLISPQVFISEAKAKSLPQYTLLENDVILGRRGEMGRSAYISIKEHGYFCGTGSLIIRLGDSFDGALYTQLMAEQRVIRHLEEEASGTTMSNLNSKILNELPIQLIPLPEQQEIVRLLEEQFTVIEQNEREIDASLKRSAALRQSILKRAFSGKLVPQDPTDEPASQLLTRIQAERTAQEAVTKKKAKKKTAKKKTARKRAKKS